MAKINSIYHTTSEEASIDSHGHNFLCIYGLHINGSFISIQNWGVSAELSEGSDVFYNKTNIAEALMKTSLSEEKAKSIAEDIATAIAPRLQTLEEQQKHQLQELMHKPETTKSQSYDYRGR